MQTDLLRYISGPSPFALWWLVIAAALIIVLAAWYAGVFMWTMPPARLRAMRGISTLHRRLLARRFARSVAATTNAYRSGAITAVQACAGYSRTLRSFLNVTTGQRAQYMHVDDLSGGALAPAAPLIAALNEARFTPLARVEVERFGTTVEELIRSWT
ncbi:hypothetical protein PT015_10595 [Candidatus Mycobacterium wuenschmannii]|uniref:Uncharacterized protein n=1 Tax=Candidatus Mycobacterium wuenschmannii TaxID=3027808 RepID=A0ABY8W5Y0_9MYCO|nr:hypothetical protein [Candidatus Mycobacterium wuenschmannii]WIM89828.1 hypothetical protein PT015_10595 [Candidatus Mycobacterium wuenschmannii]